MKRRSEAEILETTRAPSGLAAFIEREDARLEEHETNRRRLHKMREEMKARDLQEKRVAPRGRRWQHTESAKHKAKIETRKALLVADFMRDGIVVPLLAWVLDGIAAIEDKTKQNTRFKDEREALRYWYDSIARVRDGAALKNFDRIALGATIQSSTRNAEPFIDETAHAVERALAALGEEDARWLVWTYVELEPPKQERTTVVEYIPEALAEQLQLREVRRVDPEDMSDEAARRAAVERSKVYQAWLRNRGTEEERRIDRACALFRADMAEIAAHGHRAEVLGFRFDAELADWSTRVHRRDGLVELPIGTPIGLPEEPMSAAAVAYEEKMLAEKGERAPLPAFYGAAYLVAQRAGLRMTPAPFVRAAVKLVEGRVKRARKALRTALGKVRLDDGRTLVPVDLRDLPRVAVACCVGVRYADGIRLPCRTVDVEGPEGAHPAMAWVTCAVCDKPLVSGRS